ncbi:MAG: SpoIIE family protein phosphatase [Acidobacteriota bacterium]
MKKPTSRPRSPKVRRERTADLPRAALSIHRKLGAHRDPAGVADALLDALLEEGRLEKGCLLTRGSRGEIVFVRGRGGTRSVGPEEFMLSRPVIEACVESGACRTERGAEHVVAVPIAGVADVRDGTDVVYLTGRRAPRATLVPLLGAVLPGVAGALAMTRTLQRIERERRRLAGLYHLAARAGSAPDLMTLLSTALDVVIAETRSDRGFILLYGSDDADSERDMSFAVGRDRDGRHLTERDFAIDTRKISHAMRRGMAVEDLDLMGSTPGSGDLLDLEEVRFPTSLPLRLDQGPGKKSRLLGAISVDRQTEGGPEQREMLSVLSAQIASAVERFRLREAEASRIRLEEEIRQAEKVQTLLLPHRLPDLVGFKFDVEYRLKGGLGGDYYDFIPMKGDRIGIAIADVLGHSVSSAIVMSTCRTLLREYCRHHASPARILKQANDTLESDLPDDMFVTLFLAVLDLGTFEVTYANAGQCYPLHFRSAERDFEVLAVGGLPLGFQRGVEYREASFPLLPGDILVLYTDGVTELKLDAARPLGVKGLQNVVKRVMMMDHPRLAHEIYAAISEDVEIAGPPKDDVTLITLRVGRDVLRESFVIPSTEEAVKAAVERAETFARQNGFVTERILQFRLVLTEALTNALEHGNRHDREKRIAVLMTVDDKRMSIRIRDEGEGYDVERVLDHADDPDLTSSRGRGITIIRKYVTSLSVGEKGNVLTMTFTRSTF